MRRIKIDVQVPDHQYHEVATVAARELARRLEHGRTVVGPVVMAGEVVAEIKEAYC